MAAITIDTHPYIKKLEKAHIPEKQAEAHVEVITEIMTEHYDKIATTNDLQSLQASFHQDMVELKSELKQDMANLTVRMCLIMGTIVAAGVTVTISLFSTMLSHLH